MTAMPHKMDRVREIFDRAMELEPAAQAAFLVGECGQDEFLRHELESLLHLHAEARDVLKEPAPGAGEKPGDRIGHFKLLQKIGEGGFGTVWMAEQEQPVRRKVALKVLKPGMDTALVIGRFEAERQALALMDHPYIAKVFDGGATAQGRPYFVMELVKGIPIHRYCDEAGMSTSERLSLFVAVCQAVQHAHQKGIIHRDLKPSNVLVTLHDGHPVPKVIDFGIAKAIQGQLTDRTVFTEFRQMLGTPEYMAPEQAALSGLDVDTRADIYSLGVLLYELLTGTRPFELKTMLQAGYDAMLQTIKEVDPPKPSTRVSTLGEQITAIARQRRVHPRSLGSLMRGDLDWIVMKALEKERSRRYDTASALAEDVLRHLRHDPVLASPPSVAYRLRKYVRRHRVGVAAGTAIAASLAVGALLSGLGYLEAKEQSELARAAERRAGEEKTAALLARDAEQEQRRLAERRSAEAQRAAAKAKSVVDLLTSTLASSNPHENKGRNYPVRLVLADFERALQAQAKPEPEVEAALRAVVGESFLGLGMVDAAEPHVRRALELRRGAHGPRHLEVADSYLLEAYFQHERVQYAAALAALDAGDAALPGDGSAAETEQRIELLAYRIDLLRHLDRLAEAADVARTCLALAKQHHGDEHVEVASVLGHFARVLQARGDPGAEAMSRESLAMRRRLQGAAHPEVAIALNHLGLILNDRGDLAGAESAHREALALGRAAVGDEHPLVASFWSNLVGVLLRCGNLTAAEPLMRELLAIQRRVLPDDDPAVAAVLHDLGAILRERGDLASAEPMLREALAIRRKLPDDEHSLVAASLHELGFVLHELGNLDGAEPLYREAVDLRRRLLGSLDRGLAKSLTNLGMLRRDRGDLAGAETLVREAVAIDRGSPDRRDADAAGAAFYNLAVVLVDRGDAAGAEALYREALDAARTAHGEEHVRVADCAHALAGVLRTRGDLAGAEDLTRKALTMRRKLLGEDHVNVAVSLSELGVVRSARGDLEEAERLHRAALPLWVKARGAEHTDVANCLANVGGVLRQRGDLDGAERFLRDALAMRRKLLGAEHEQVARTLFNLGAVLAKRGDVTGAGQCYIEAMASFRRLLGDHHADVADCQAALARCLLSLGNHAEAEPLARASLASRAAEHPDSWQHHSAMALLGRALAGMGRFAEAEPLLVEACTKAQPPAAASHLLREALACLIDGYERAGRLEQVAPWQEKLRALEASGAKTPGGR